MARIRTIKPGFFKNEELAEIPVEARLLFIGLWCLADKEGRLEDRPKRIKAEIFPYDNVDVNEMLEQLKKFNFIYRYTVDNLSLIQIINFSKHQRITGTEATSESTFPAYKESPRKQSGNTSETPRTTGKERIYRKGDKERKGKEEGEKSPGEIVEEKLLILKHPFSEKFIDDWINWKNYKKNEFKFLYKSFESEQAALTELVHLSDNNEEVAVKIINKSIASGWKGFFKLKKEDYGTTYQQNNQSGNFPGGGGVKANERIGKLANLGLANKIRNGGKET